MQGKHREFNLNPNVATLFIVSSNLLKFNLQAIPNFVGILKVEAHI